MKLHPHVVLRYAGLDYNSDEKLVARGSRNWDGWVKAATMVQFRPNLLLAGRKEGAALFVHKLCAGHPAHGGTRISRH